MKFIVTVNDAREQNKNYQMIEINPNPVFIGSVWYYEKVNCYTYERYISVDEYNRRHGIGQSQNANKQVEVYDTKKNEVLNFESAEKCRQALKIAHSTLHEALKGNVLLTKGRYKIKFKSKEKEQENNWEYSNKNFN